jgi:hypothetical protein
MNIRDVAMEQEVPTGLVLPQAAAGERWGIVFATTVVVSVREWKHRLFDNPRDTVVQRHLLAIAGHGVQWVTSRGVSSTAQ